MTQAQGLERVRNRLFVPSRLLSFRDGFRRYFPAKSMLIAHHVLTHLGTRLRSVFLAKPTLIAKRANAHFFTGFGRVFPTLHCRASLMRHVIAPFTKGLELVQPILFTGCQGYGQYPFQDLEGESVGAILIPGPLQVGVWMLVLAKFSEVVVSAMAQVYSTPNVELASDSTHNAVNARCSSDSVHANCLSLAPCLFRCQAGKATHFLQKFMRPLLDSTLKYIFFHSTSKAEGRSHTYYSTAILGARCADLRASRHY